MYRSRRFLAAAAAVPFALLAASCGGDDADSDSAAPPTTAEEGAATGGATFTFTPLDAGGRLTKAALQNGDIQVALLLSSDADIAVNDWVELEDDKNLQQIENVVPAIRSDALTPAIGEALDAVSERLTTEELIAMNAQNSVDLEEPADIAEEWLADQDLVPYDGDAVTGQIVIGSTNFAEQEIVAELYSQVLEAAGADVERRFQLGSREVVAPALESGEIDLYPEYLGTYLNFVDAQATVPSDPEEAAAALNELLEPMGLEVLTPAPAEDRNTFVVTRETADKYDLSTVSDLADVNEELVLGGPPECPERPFCLVGLKDTYGLKFNV